MKRVRYVRDPDLGVTLRKVEPTARERKIARHIAQGLWFTEYRNLSVLKRLACLRAAKALIETLEGGE